MVRRPRKKSSPLSPYPKRFFTIFFPHQSSTRMKFPSSFLKYFDRPLPLKSIIISRASTSWYVYVEKVGEDLYFHKGWEQFVQHNSLEFGDFQIFSYDGNSTFRAKIYGRNGCEKDYHTRRTSGRSSALVKENQQVEKKDRSKGLDHREIKDASEFKSDFPFFKLIMQPRFNSYVNVPASFAKRHIGHMTSHKQGITLVYLDKSWPVIVNRLSKRNKRRLCRSNKKGLYKSTKLRLSGGWSRFLKDNAVKEGDICIFELVDGENDIFKVNVFRCSD